jgi:hypothetical protein
MGTDLDEFGTRESRDATQTGADVNKPDRDSCQNKLKRGCREEHLPQNEDDM